MADPNLVMHVTVCHCSEAELVDRLARAISEHLTETRHPDGIAPRVLAEDLVERLRSGPQILLTKEDVAG